MKLLFFDTETTSVKPGHICQLSYITVDTSTKPQTTIGKNFFFTVDEMDPSAQEVHGFSLEKLYELSNGLEFLEQLQYLMVMPIFLLVFLRKVYQWQLYLMLFYLFLLDFFLL